MKKKGKENTPHIGIFGNRNAGKSSLINAMAEQDIAIVSQIPGTTTDPVKKSIEIKDIGSVILIDTAGIDDIGNIGEKRINKTIKTISEIDLAILVTNGNTLNKHEKELIKKFKEENLPFFIIRNKTDITPVNDTAELDFNNEKVILFSAKNATQKDCKEIFETIKEMLPPSSYTVPSLLGDIITQGDLIVLVTPIDEEAPEGRLILPQVQTIRDILDNDAIAIVVKERELDVVFSRYNINPKLVITDSQAFNKVAATVPNDILLTSFSIVLARLKGDFYAYIEGTPKISELKDGDKILLLESCTHQVSCEDIGRVKIPRWIRNFTGKKLDFKVVSGLNDLPNLSDYAMVIQCGGCIVTRKQLQSRIQPAINAGISVSNYGMTIAYVQGVFHRAIQPFVKNTTSDIYL